MVPIMERKLAAKPSPLGEEPRASAARRRAKSPEYAALERQYEKGVAIADLCILHRTRQGLTQADLAQRMGTTVSAISRLESGFQTNHKVETLKRLAEALGGRVEIGIVFPADEAESRTTVLA